MMAKNKETASPATAKKVVAGYVPSHLVDRLSLYSTIHNIPRASIIELIVTKILEDAPSVETMIELLSLRAIDNCTAETKQDMKTWANKYRQGLRRRKIPVAIVDKILAPVLSSKKKRKDKISGKN